MIGNGEMLAILTDISATAVRPHDVGVRVIFLILFEFPINEAV